MWKLIVLDYTSGEVHVYPIPEDMLNTPELFLGEDGEAVIHSDCHYMTVRDLKLFIH